MTLFSREAETEREREAAEEERESKSLVRVQEGKEGSQVSLTRGEGTPTVTTWESLGDSSWGSETLRSRAIMGTQLLGG